MKAAGRMAAGWLVVAGVAGCASLPVMPQPAPASAPVATMAPSPPAPAPVEIPTPQFYRTALQRNTRSESGAPGQAYWQNKVSYRIDAELDPATATIRGSERIVYHNRSPDSLNSIVLNLYQNIFSEGVPRNRYAPITGGVTLESVSVNGVVVTRRPASEIPVLSEGQNPPVGYSVQGTLGRIRLPRALEPGDSVSLEIEWQHRVPPAPGGFRTAWEDALGDPAFLVAQWYPQVAVYDDLKGWDTTPYLGDGEFYLEYADFEVAITVPSGFLVGATGELTNPEEVLTEEARRRLDAVLTADSITRIVTDADLSADNATQRLAEGTLTWRFRVEGVRDFAFATSAGYVWDATRARVGPDSDPRYVAVHALYRPGAPNWENAAAFARHATETLSTEVVPYPYPRITATEGSIGGMEYPMVVFIPKPAAELSLYGVIAHEIAHEWFPMLVGQDEAAYAWMDEGMATLLEAVAVGEASDIADPNELDRESYLEVAGSDTEVPLMTHTDLVSPYGDRIVAAYFKPSMLFRALSHLLGAETFHSALRTYIAEWSNRHPTPWDFFRTLERVHGSSLGWFIRPWWFGVDVLDYAIDSVRQTAEGVAVLVERRGTAPAPAIVVGWTATGDSVVTVLPFERWTAGVDTISVVVPSQSPIVRVRIDPARFYPDVDTDNDNWSFNPIP